MTHYKVFIACLVRKSDVEWQTSTDFHDGIMVVISGTIIKWLLVLAFFHYLREPKISFSYLNFIENIQIVFSFSYQLYWLLKRKNILQNKVGFECKTEFRVWP